MGRTPRQVAIVGAGSWGTTAAALTCRNAPTVLWARRAELADEINSTRRNAAYLPAFELPDGLVATSSLRDAVAAADVVVMAVPSHGYRAVAAELADLVRPTVPIVSLSKGLEPATLLRMSQVTREELAGHAVAVLTGPNLAKELLAGQPAAAVIATGDGADIDVLRTVFAGPNLRVYTNPDVIGAEVGGVVKNVVAIAVGMAEGMAFGHNTRATLITRGLAEMTRLAVSMGGEAATLAGLAGMGDLIATCSSPQSRNHRVGVRLGRGEPIGDILAAMDTHDAPQYAARSQVAEGVMSSLSVLELSRRHDVAMPITEQVVAVCHEGRPAAGAMQALMERSSGSEMR